MTFKTLQAEQAKELLAADQATFVDIRDPQSFQQSHIKGATRLDNDNLSEFIAGQDKARPLVVCCYHGMSSQNAAQFLVEQGFQEVYSLEGGFEFWRSCQPDFCEGSGLAN